MFEIEPVNGDQKHIHTVHHIVSYMVDKGAAGT